MHVRTRILRHDVRGQVDSKCVFVQAVHEWRGVHGGRQQQQEEEAAAGELPMHMQAWVPGYTLRDQGHPQSDPPSYALSNAAPDEQADEEMRLVLFLQGLRRWLRILQRWAPRMLLVKISRIHAHRGTKKRTPRTLETLFKVTHLRCS